MSKFLHRPVTPWKITQHFGEDRLCTDGKKLFKKETHQKCPAGTYSVYRQTNGHNGIDLIAKRWQPVYSGADGYVREVSTEEPRGLGVGVVTKVGNTYFKHRYWHLISLNVHEGEEVEVGSLLGYADSTGLSTGDHLHLEVKECTEMGGTKNMNNGHLGALNPELYLYDSYALDVMPLNRKVKELMAKLIDHLSDILRNQT